MEIERGPPAFKHLFAENVSLEIKLKSVDSWKVLDDAGVKGLSGRIKDIEFVDDFLKKNPGKAAEVTAGIKSKGWQKWVDEIAKGAGKLSDQIDNTISRLRNTSKFELDNTGKYADVFGHHPLAKSGFRDNFPTEAAFKQYYDEAFSVSIPQLEKFGGKGIHAKITGEQNTLYTRWRKANPNAKMTIDDMANIEIQAMVNKGIPQDVATGWVVKALEKLKSQGVTDISNIPWNGVN
jgi:hypothetical protein